MLQIIEPVKPVAPYIGGKIKLASRICHLIEQIPHDTYAEPFVGMGGVFFRRAKKPKCEIINDRSGKIANLFRILQRHYLPFVDMLKFQIYSRAEFDRLKTIDPSTLTDLERAARFLYLQRAAFGGKVKTRTFGVSTKYSARFDMARLQPMLEDVHQRLSSVIIENLDWLDFINRYDRPDTLFYLDPPYWGSENDYGKGVFNREQFAIMAESLARIKGNFILSINDVPQIRELFSRFHIMEASVTYSIKRDNSKPAKELIISNWDPSRGHRETVILQ